MPYTYDYPRPMVTVDIIVISKSKNADAEILLIQRKNEPFKDCWALPGGFIEMDENLEQSALRELQEETGITGVQLSQFYTFGDPERDPRGRTVSVIFYCFADKQTLNAKAGDDAAFLDWFSIFKLPQLAFDHSVIVKMAIEKLL